MAARKITRRPWNLRPGDVLSDGRIVARVSMVPGRFTVIMRNGAALSGDASAPSVTVTRESAAPSSSTVWRSVRGADLVVGMRVRFSNVVHTVVDMVDVPAYVDPGTGWTIRDAYAVVVTRHAWHVDEARGVLDRRTPYRVLFTAPRNAGGVPVIDAATVRRYVASKS